MKEVIILEVNESRKSQLIQGFLKSKKIDYRILVDNQLELSTNSTEQERKKEQKTDIFANYGEAIKDKQREQEADELENAEQEDIVNEE
jgi:hypothetical protein